MAHTYNTNKNTLARGRSAAGRNLAVVVPSGATLLVCMIVVDGLTARTGGAPTWNSGAQTFLQADQNRYVTSTGETISEMWYLIAPAAGSFNIHIPDDNNMYFSADACSFSAAAGKTSALRVGNGASNTSTNPAGPSLTGLAVGDLLVAVVGNGATTWSPTGRAGTQLYDVDDGTWGHGSQYLIKVDTNNTAMTWTYGSSFTWGLCEAAFKEVTTYTPLAADAGSFPLSGTAAGFVRGYVVAATTKSFPLTGTAATLVRNLVVGAATKSFPLSGTAVGFVRSLVLSAGSQSFPLSGAPAGVLYNRRLAAGSQSFPLTGTDATFSITRHLTMAADGQSFPLSGTAVTFLRSLRLSSGTRSFPLSGTTAGLLRSLRLAVETKNFPWTGIDADLSVATGEDTLDASAGAFPFAGTAAGLLASRMLSADSQSFPWIGSAVTFNKTTNLMYELCYLIKA